MFPGAGATIYRNEAGEVTGWDYPAEPDYDPFADLYDEDDEDDDGGDVDHTHTCRDCGGDQDCTEPDTVCGFNGSCDECNDELNGCEGHEAGPFDPMGETVYCDGSCRQGAAR
jgi:hypothetical protein